MGVVAFITVLGIVLFFLVLGYALSRPRIRGKRTVDPEPEEKTETETEIDMDEILAGAREKRASSMKETMAFLAAEQAEREFAYESLVSHVEGLKFLLASGVPGATVLFAANGRQLEIACHNDRYEVRAHRLSGHVGIQTLRWGEVGSSVSKGTHDEMLRDVLHLIAKWLAVEEKRLPMCPTPDSDADKEEVADEEKIPDSPGKRERFSSLE